MSVSRVKLLARQILADVLAVGSAATASPVLSPQQETDVLDAIELRLQGLFGPHGHETDDQLKDRFRRTHPELFQGTPEERRQAAVGRRSEGDGQQH